VQSPAAHFLNASLIGLCGAFAPETLWKQTLREIFTAAD
jgi:hypothetical protein